MFTIPFPRAVAPFLAAACLLPAATCFAEDWPQFGGPNRDMTTSERVPPKVFDKPEEAWKAEIGIGYSGPAVVGEAVYVMGHEDGKEHVRRLDAASGDVVWTHSYPGELVDNLNAGGPGATPSVVGNQLFTVGRQGQVYCLNASDGSVVWNVDLPQTFGVEVPDWGFTCSPLVIGDRVIVDANGLIALNRQTGKTLWKSAPHTTGYGTAMPFDYGGKTCLAHFTNDGLTVAELATGKELAFTEFESQYNTAATTPVIEGNRLFISAGYDGACALFEFDGSSLTEIYRNKNLKNHFSNSVPVGDYLYGISGQTSGSRNCQLVCLNFATGEAAWSQRGGGFGSVIAAGDQILYLNDVGQIATVAADPKAFKVNSTAKIMSGQCWTAPVLANGRLYCRNSEGNLVVLKVGK